MQTSPTLSLRDRFGSNLSIKAWTTLELLLVAAVSLLRLFHPFLILLLVLISFWARRQSYRTIGLGRPASWLKTTLIGLGLGVALALLGYGISLLVPTPVVTRDLGQFSGVRGNGLQLVAWLAFTWLFTVILEEVVYRAYLINRIVDLLGSRLAGLAAALLVSSLLFGLVHLALQDVGGAISTFISGLVYGGLFLLTRRKNLWLPILVHGASNTIALVGLYLGWL